MFQNPMHGTSRSNDGQSAQSTSDEFYKPSAQEESALKHQEQLKDRTQEMSRAAVDEAARRMRHEAEVQTVQLQRQSLEGSAKQIDEMVRQGASAKEFQSRRSRRTSVSSITISADSNPLVLSMTNGARFVKRT